MSIEVKRIDPSQAARLLLDADEGHFLDFKAKAVSPGKLSKIVSAFANADGGDFYVGIDEDKIAKVFSWNGFSSPEDANGHIQLFEELFPLSDDFQYEFIKTEGQAGLVLHVNVLKTAKIIKASDGTPYIRRSAQSLPVRDPEALKRLSLDKGLSSFETETVNVDKGTITDSLTIVKFMIEIIPSAEPEPWLKKQQLLHSDQPTVAGVLLFADEPQAALPKRSGIKIYRYKTSAPIGARESLAFDPITIEGPAYDQIYETVRQAVNIIQSISVLSQEGFEKARYPDEAIHEIVTNAVLHRDYSVADDVHVRIFDNRIEVESPGKLAGHVTVDNILAQRFSRNGAMVRLINKFPNPPNKDVGEGLNTAFDAMRKLKLKEPVIAEKDNSVLVVMRHEPLASPEEIIMEYLSKNDSIGNAKGRDICFINSESVMKKTFERLMESNLIEHVPGTSGRAFAYRIVHQEK